MYYYRRSTYKIYTNFKVLSYDEKQGKTHKIFVHNTKFHDACRTLLRYARSRVRSSTYNRTTGRRRTPRNIVRQNQSAAYNVLYNASAKKYAAKFQL